MVTDEDDELEEEPTFVKAEKVKAAAGRKPKTKAAEPPPVYITAAYRVKSPIPRTCKLRKPRIGDWSGGCDREAREIRGGMAVDLGGSFIRIKFEEVHLKLLRMKWQTRIESGKPVIYKK